MKIWLLRMIILGWIVQAQAFAAVPVQLDDVLHSVNQHYPVIKVAQQNIDKAEAEHLAAQGAFDPNIKSSLTDTPVGTYENHYWDSELSVPTQVRGIRWFAGYRKGDGNFPVYDQNYLTDSWGETRVGLDFPLLRNASIDSQRAKLLQTSLGVSLQEQQYQLTRLNVVQAASYAYWNWVGAGKKLILYQHLYDLAHERQIALEKRHALGDAARMDLIENQRLILQRQIAFLLAQRYFQKTSFYLSLYYRNAQGKPIILDDQALPAHFPLIPSHSSLNNQWFKENALIEAHPEIQSLNKQKQISELDVALARNAFLPKLESQLYTSRDYGNRNVYLNRESYSVGLKFEVPLYQRQARGDLVAAEATIQKLNEQKQLAHDRIRVELLDAQNQVDTMRLQALMIHQEVALAQQIEHAEDIRFEQGASNLFLVNQREQSTFDTQLKEIDAFVDYFQAKADLVVASGTYSSSSLS